jgi:hypothetical protein
MRGSHVPSGDRIVGPETKGKRMSEALILEFDGVKADKYAEVNRALGIDPSTGEGDWPAGLLDHTGAVGDHLVVFELWESREAQQAFMDARLGPALGKLGLPEPSRAEWMSVAGHHAD